MKEFLKYLFASVLGILIAGFIFFFVVIFAVTGLVSSSQSKKQVLVKPNSILVFDLNQEIVEQHQDNPFAELEIPGFPIDPGTIGLNKLLAAIEKAKNDDNIKGIYFKSTVVGGGLATRKAIRDAMIDFQESGKFIVSYNEFIGNNNLYFTSIADRSFLNPSGMMLFNGFGNKIMFYKGMFDKLGIEMNLIRAGTYKSAGEPFIRQNLSENNREQISSFLNNLYSTYLSEVGEALNLHPDTLRNIANDLRIQQAQDAVNYKLVSDLGFEDQAIAYLMEEMGVDKRKDLNFVNIKKYIKNVKSNTGIVSDKIAVIYAEGEIRDGKSTEGVMGSETIAAAVREAANNSKVKAIVIRVNSPGGSALASDVMLREIELAKAKKPVLVSMGDLAASGGYLIACKADTIIAEPTTITGSIGVFGLFPNMAKLLNDKIGLTFDGVNLGKYADLGSVERPMRADEMAFFQNMVNQTYKDFVQKVADGRKKDFEYVAKIAEGRVYSGNEALAIGLVDGLGNLQTTVELAAKRAGIEQYNIMPLPKLKDPFTTMLENMQSETRNSNLIRKEFGQAGLQLWRVNQLLQTKGNPLFMRMDTDFNID